MVSENGFLRVHQYLTVITFMPVMAIIKQHRSTMSENQERNIQPSIFPVLILEAIP
jgi:hypothetical protein